MALTAVVVEIQEKQTNKQTKRLTCAGWVSGKRVRGELTALPSSLRPHTDRRETRLRVIVQSAHAQ